MEQRKETEIKYYDKGAENILKDSDWSGDFEGFNPLVLESFQFFYSLLQRHCKDKIVLDFGCGNGVHSIFPLEAGAQKIFGIDLSSKSLEVAKKRVQAKGFADRTEFKLADCEETGFSNDSFDVIMDGGTFSSLDIKNTYAEIVRILKPGGYLIGIETFGHNPLTNFKRKINKLIGKRTDWAEGHIFNNEYIKMAGNFFEDISVNYFHPLSWAAFPFLNLPGGKFLLSFLQRADKILLKFPFLRKYSFKVVFIFSKPKKNYKSSIISH
jgi:ubiquinone/menaquinone biosynthesis C-methylase UbiE